MPNDVSSPAGVLQCLRSATHSHHAELENMLALTGPHSRRRYEQVLQGFQAFVPTWENRVAAALPTHLQGWFAPRRRSALIATDLAALGAAPAAEVAPSAQALHLGSLPRALGSLYVMEGSTLGGQVITRHLAESLQLSPQHGAAYFYGHGRETGPMWKDFLARLSAELPTDAGAEQAAAGAADTFAALITLFAPLDARLQ